MELLCDSDREIRFSNVRQVLANFSTITLGRELLNTQAKGLSDNWIEADVATRIWNHCILTLSGLHARSAEVFYQRL
jgi:hypothetical protein